MLFWFNHVYWVIVWVQCTPSDIRLWWNNILIYRFVYHASVFIILLSPWETFLNNANFSIFKRNQNASHKTPIRGSSVLHLQTKKKTNQTSLWKKILFNGVLYELEIENGLSVKTLCQIQLELILTS